MSAIKEPMTRKRLEQYRSLGKEISILEQEIKQAAKIADTVRASSREAPYLQHTVVITGTDARARVRLDRKCRKAARERREIEKYIDALEDSQLRTIMELRYLKGLSWSKVAGRMGRNTADSVRFIVIRHLEKQ